MRFRKFQTWILFFSLGLLSVILISSLSVVNIVFKQSTESKIHNDLDVAKRVFTRLIEVQTQRLSDNAFLLSSDFGFKQVIATQDQKTISSALENLLLRIGADKAILVSLQNQVLADTAHPDQNGVFFAPEIINLAEQFGAANAIVLIDEVPHQMVVTPILAPDVKAWLCISFKISQIQVDELQQLTQSHISLLLAPESGLPLLISSSLPEKSSKNLVATLQKSNWRKQNTFTLPLDNSGYITSVLNLSNNQQIPIIAVLQKSVDEELIPFYRLQWFLLVIAVVSLMLAFVGSLLVSRSISRPIKALVTGVRAVAKGDYDYRIKADRADEIGELNSAFNEMAMQQGHQESLRLAKESAESASQAKTDFLANMSHELRTPLNSILGYAQLLKMQDFNAKQQTKALNTIEQSGKHLLSLINEILDLSKIEAGQLQLQSAVFSLRQLLNILFDTLQDRAESKGLQLNTEFHFNESIWINSDEQRLRQILTNLVDNAIKYTEAGQIDFKVSRTALGHYHFLVQDTGIGIRPEHLHSIFTSFHQLHQTHDYIEGTGLGLAISKQLVELLGGELKVSSTIGQGSQFWFELDLQEVDQADFSETVLSTRSLITRMQGYYQKILIADDKADNRTLLHEMLAPLGFAIAEADNGQDCLEQALNWKPDIILIDSKMPVMDGPETCQRIRASAELKDIVIIIISAHVFESHRKLCIEAGANDFIAKPIQLEALLNVLARHTGLLPEHDSDYLTVTEEKTGEPEAMSYPDQDTLKLLLVFAEKGDIQAIQHLAVEIAQGQQDCHVFIEQIKNLADGFQIKKIREIVSQVLLQMHKK